MAINNAWYRYPPVHDVKYPTFSLACVLAEDGLGQASPPPRPQLERKPVKRHLTSPLALRIDRFHVMPTVAN